MKLADKPLEANTSVQEGAPAEDIERPVGRFPALEIGSFRVFLASSVFSMFAQSMQQVAQGYLAYTLTNSAVAIGIVSLGLTVTMAPLSFIAGAVADRVAKRRQILITQAVAAVTALVVATLIVTGRIQIWHLVVAGLVQGAVQAFNLPARQSIIPEMVGKVRLASAMPLVSLVGNLSRICGPSLAGLLLGVALFGIHGTYYSIAAALCIAAVTSLWLPPSPKATTQEGKKESLFGSVLAGLRYLRHSPYLMLMIGMVFLSLMLSQPTQQLLPVFNKLSLDGSVGVLGLLYAATATGTLVSSLSLVWFKYPKESFKHQILFAFVAAIALVLLSLVHDYRLALALLFVMGFCQQSFMTLNFTAVMGTADPAYTGRVMSIHQLPPAFVPTVTLPLSALADGIGISQTFTIAGLSMAVIVLVVAFLGSSRVLAKMKPL